MDPFARRHARVGASFLLALALLSVGATARCFGQAQVAGEGQVGILVPTPAQKLDVAEAVGLAVGAKPESLTWERVYPLAVVRFRSGAKGQPAAGLDIAALAKADGVADFERFRREFLDPTGTFPDPS